MKSEIDEAKEMLNDKVPDSIRLKWALKQLGKQASYIEELKDENKNLQRMYSSLLNMTPEERRHMKNDAIYKQKTEQINKLQKQVSKLRSDYELLLTRYNTKK